MNKGTSSPLGRLTKGTLPPLGPLAGRAGRKTNLALNPLFFRFLILFSSARVHNLAQMETVLSVSTRPDYRHIFSKKENLRKAFSSSFFFLCFYNIRVQKGRYGTVILCTVFGHSSGPIELSYFWTSKAILWTFVPFLDVPTDLLRPSLVILKPYRTLKSLSGLLGKPSGLDHHVRLSAGPCCTIVHIDFTVFRYSCIEHWAVGNGVTADFSNY